MINEVNAQRFFDAILDAGGDHHMSKKDDIVIHIVTGPADTIIIPIKDVYEDLPGENVATWLSLIGLTYLIPFLVPDHPLADFINKLPPGSSI